MNKQKLVDLFKQPSTIDAKHLDEIEDIVNENPYFHSAYALIALGRKKLNPKQATKDLIKAAIYATNRVNLKRYLEAGLGGSQASSEKDAVVERPLTEKKIVSAESTPPPAEKETVQKPESKELERRPLRTKIVSKEEKDSDKVTTVTRPADIDLDKILDTLKSEYKQLEVNIKNFDQAEKSLSAVEIKEASEVKTANKKSAVKIVTKKAVSTAKKPTAKKTTATAKKPTAKATSTKTTVKKKRTTGSSITDPKSDDSGSKKKEQNKLIDQFIKSEPKITRKKDIVGESENQEDLSSKNHILTDDMVTENLAAIMVKQGRFEKAIEIYNKLIWKFPHKKAYFAGRIKDLKEQ